MKNQLSIRTRVIVSVSAFALVSIALVAPLAYGSRETLSWWTILVLLSIYGAGLLAVLSVVRSSVVDMNRGVRNLTDKSQDLQSSTSQITHLSQELAQAASEQASALQQTATSIREINNKVIQTAENASRSRRVASASHDAATQGKVAVKEMIEAINEINRSNSYIMGQIDESNKKIGDIIRMIGEIGNKTKIINDIVFQTKLLSFNASVEAARAGEHGKGFAVVAQEVGNLAQISGNAAKEITEMLNSSVAKVEGIVTEMKTKVEGLISEGKDKIDAGTATARQCEGALEKIVTDVSDVNIMMVSISESTEEQSRGVQEITKAINELNDVTHHNGTAFGQLALSSENLSAEVGKIVKAVWGLKKLVNGTETADTTAGSEEPRSSNVINLPKPATKRSAGKDPASLRKSVGENIPSDDDPRFKEV